MSKVDLASQLKNVSKKDLEQIEKAQEMLGPDPETMGFIKNIYWGNLREDLIFPFPEEPTHERERCDKLLVELDAYFRNEHPAIEIDQNQEIPDWVIKRFFEMGVGGMIVPKEYGGQGFGVTSYNRVLERIGRSCGSSAVLISAHLSIGCNAITLFGTEEQKATLVTDNCKRVSQCILFIRTECRVRRAGTGNSVCPIGLRKILHTQW